MIQPRPSESSRASDRKSDRAARRGRPIRAARPMSLCLCDFDSVFAPTIASWVRSDRELLWLAPRTRPPLTSAKVMAWARDRSSRILLWDAASASPVGYAELNEMPGERDHLWIGHLLASPQVRGRKIGHRFVHALLCRAFQDLMVRQVSLVVFPDNIAAIRCYEANGMQHAGREFKYVKETGARHEFLRMALTHRRFETLTREGVLPQRSILFIDDAAMLRRGPVRLPSIAD